MSFVRFMGVQTQSSAGEKVFSTAGGIVSIGLIFYISSIATGLQGAMAILPSMRMMQNTALSIARSMALTRTSRVRLA